MKRDNLSIAGAIMALAVGPVAMAADHETSSEEREEILITASPLGDVLQPSKVLSGQELMLKTAPSLGETLSNELGVNSTYYGPAASRPVIRGQQGSRVKMLNGSVSTLDVSDTSPDHAVQVEPLLADQIEIIRGPATLLYGSAAAGGVVNVKDGRIPEEPAEKAISGGFEARGDTAANEETQVGRLDGGWGNFAWHVDGFTRDTDNLEIPGFATADPAERSDEEQKDELANSYSEADGGSLGLSWVGDRGFLGAAVSVQDQTYGLPGPGEEEEGEEGEEEPAIFEGPFIDMEQTRVDVRGEYRFDAGALEKVRFSFANNDYEHVEIEPSGEVATEFDNEAWQGRVEAVHSEIAGWRGAFGIQLDDRDFSAVGEEAFVSPTTTESWGIFLVEELDLDAAHIHVGLRVEDLEHDNDTLADYDDTAWSLGAGVAFDVPADSEIFVDLSFTQRHAAAEELYANGSHIATRLFEVGLLAEPDSKAELEEATNVEIGWRRNDGDITWESSVYFYDYSDFIYLEETGEIEDGLPVAVYDQDDAEFWGVEGAVTVPVWTGNAMSTDLRLFGDYVSAELSNGDDLPRIPPWRLGANFGVYAESWSGGLDVIYHAEQDDISSFNTDSYTMVDLNYVYNIDANQLNWDVFFRVSNLLDEEARKSTSFIAAFAPLPGRSVHGGLRVKF